MNVAIIAVDTSTVLIIARSQLTRKSWSIGKRSGTRRNAKNENESTERESESDECTSSLCDEEEEEEEERRRRKMFHRNQKERARVAN